MSRTDALSQRLKGAHAVPLTLREKQSIVRELALRYRKASKKEKGQLVDQLRELVGYNRCYASRVLRQMANRSSSRSVKRRPHRRRAGRRPRYGDDVHQALRKVWAIMSFACGKRLAPFMNDLIFALERHGELRLTPALREQLVAMSAATIDRLLAPDRAKMRLKGRTGTKPGGLLKHTIPIRTFADWDDHRPGFLEIDLVGHQGSNSRGEFAQTLDMVDIATGWTETVAVKNKAQRWVFEAITQKLAVFPFPILGIDSDNGSEFINDHLTRFCEQNRITFTRSRPSRKNDNCYVEQKNWAVVRKFVGYMRYDTPEQLAVLNQLYDTLRLYTNFFQPQQKLLAKTREGAKVRRTYDAAMTPYQRVLASPVVSDTVKTALDEQYATLNPAALRRDLSRLQQTLWELLPASLRDAELTVEVPHFEYN